jgi:hypothetical protein
MDPNATLRVLLDALHDRNVTVAEEALRMLLDWIDRGGFLPTDPRSQEPGDASLSTALLCQQYAGLMCAHNRALLEIDGPDGIEIGGVFRNLAWDLVHQAPKAAQQHLDLCKRVVEISGVDRDSMVTDPSVVLMRASVRVP